MSFITHTFVCGASRSGKSEAELARLLPMAQANDCAIVLLDPPGTLASKFLLHLDHRGLTNRVIYDRLSDTDRVPGYDWLSPSVHPDPLQREAANDERIREFASILLRRRGIHDTAGTPLIEEGLLAALGLYIHQRTPASLSFLTDVFTLGSPARDQLLRNCTEPELLRKFETYAKLSPTARRTETGPAERILQAVCGSPAFRVRAGGPTFDFDRFLDRRGILILDGSSRGNLSRDAASVMMGAVILRVIHHCRTRANGRVVLVLDEAVNANLVGVHESRALAEAGKWGLEFHVIVQDPFNFPSEDICNNVLQNCYRHEWFRQGSPAAAKLAAQDVATPLLDPLKLHHVEYRFRNIDAGYEQRTTITRTERKSVSGTITGRSLAQGDVYLLRRKEVRDEQQRYTTLNDQIALMQKELMRLRAGFRLVRGDRVDWSPEYVPLVRPPWVVSQAKDDAAQPLSDRLTQYRVQAILGLIKSRATYRTPSPERHGREFASLQLGAARRLAKSPSANPK
jgi:hypothetical protein